MGRPEKKSMDPFRRKEMKKRNIKPLRSFFVSSFFLFDRISIFDLAPGVPGPSHCHLALEALGVNECPCLGVSL